MKSVILIIEDRVKRANGQIAYDLSMQALKTNITEPWRARRIKNNKSFIVEAEKAVEILRSAFKFKESKIVWDAALEYGSENSTDNTPKATICPHYGKEIVNRYSGESEVIHRCHSEGKQ